MKPTLTFPFLFLAGLLFISCAVPRGDPGAMPDFQPGARPALDTDEAGLWMTMDRVEETLKTSGRRITDPALNTYIRDIVCKLAGPHCSDIRIYIMQQPYFNASMAPNGTMQVWTGFLLRAENEAQLAYVLGHEIGHYQRRHTLQRWRDARSTTDLLVIFQLASIAAGVPVAGQLAQLVAIGSLHAFSRDNEREADDVGFELMVKAGYDPKEAPRIWEALIKEREASDKEDPFIFLATHPPTEERIETLKTSAREISGSDPRFEVGKDRLYAAISSLRFTLLRDELRRREFKETQVLLDRLIENGAGLGELHFFQGELYRLRAEEGDRAKAVTAYQKALEFEDAPVETHRTLGLLFLKSEEKPNAREALKKYLSLDPDAEDQEMIRAYLQQLE